MPELLTTRQVARLLQEHPKHVYRLLKRGLPGRKVGGEWRFLPDEVLAWTGRGRASDPAAPRPDRTGSAPDPPPLVAANGDLAVEALLELVRSAGGPLLGLLPADRSSALRHLEAGAVLLGGHHGPESGYAGESDSGQGPTWARIRLVEREVGLVARTEWRLPGLPDLARVRLASRPPTAGVRILLDQALRDAGCDPAAAHADARLLDSHRDVVLAVTTGRAQAGIATRAWARRAGLAFAPLAREGYDLLAPWERLDDPRVGAVVDAASSPAFRDAVGGLGGYDPAAAGEVAPSPGV